MAKILQLPKRQTPYQYEKISFLEAIAMLSFYFAICFSMLIIVPIIYFYRWVRRKR
jgi:hypothetical protein